MHPVIMMTKQKFAYTSKAAKSESFNVKPLFTFTKIRKAVDSKSM